MLVVEENIYSIEEYFELEKNSEIRHEFVHGTLIPMPAESKRANEIAFNCAFTLRQLLINKSQKIYNHE